MKQKRQHGGARPGAGRRRGSERSSGLALTIRLDFEEVMKLISLCEERKVSMRNLIVDLIREHLKLPAKPRSARQECERISGIVGGWIRTRGRIAPPQGNTLRLVPENGEHRRLNWPAQITNI